MTFPFAPPSIAVIDADGLHRRDAVQRADHEAVVRAFPARPVRRAENVLEREVLAADVVRQADHRDAAVVVENVDIAAPDVFVRNAVGAVEAAEGRPAACREASRC